MTTAADVIAAINRRHLLKAGYRTPPGQVPAGWKQWFDETPPDDGLAARAEAWVAVLARHLRYANAADAGLGQPFFHLQALGRPPDPRAERGLRIGAGALDISLHVLMAACLLWLMYLNFVALAPKQDAGEVVQVRFIGRGNAEAGGGAKAATPALRAPVVTPDGKAVAAAQAEPSPAAPVLAANIQRAVMPTQPALARTATTLELTRQAQLQLPAAQPLQVSAVPQPQPGDFRLPPTRKLEVQLPAAALPEAQPLQQVESLPTLQPLPVRQLQATLPAAQVQAATPQRQVVQIETLQAQALPALQPELPAAKPQVAQLRTQVQALERFEPRQLPEAVPELPRTPSEVQVQALRTQVQALPNRPAPAPVVDTASAVVPSAQVAPATRPEGQGLLQAGKGAGAATKPTAGGWQSLVKSDDWGAAKRNANGNGAQASAATKAGDGVFDADGSVRLPDQWQTQDGLDLDRAGTWLERPGLEYKATRFDKYWIPSGSLLEEWVRKGVKQLAIPIPGTSLKLQCVISLLELGGGCMPVNPDVNEQPSSGRPAPDIPFKPALQEDNGSVLPQPGS